MNPILIDIFGSIISKAIAKKSIDPKVIVADAVTEIAKNPVVINETNGEKPYQSRVVLGASTATAFATVTAAAIVYDQIRSGTFDPAVLGPAVATLLAAGYALYGRLKSGLKPLFHKA